MNTHDMIGYMLERSSGQVIDAPEDDPILLQAEADGYADRADGYWIGRGHIQPGERRVVRFIFGGMKVIFGKDE